MRYLLLGAILFVCCFTSITAQDPNSEEYQKAWQEAMAPGEMHAMLARAAGEWKTKATMWMDPNAEPMVSEGSVSSEMILGGRYLRSTHKGNFMGMPMDGIAIEGYNNIKKKFINTWIDVINLTAQHCTGNPMPYHRKISGSNWPICLVNALRR